MSNPPDATAVQEKRATSFNLDFDEASNLVTVAAHRRADMDTRLESLRALRRDPRFREDYDILCKFLDKKHVPDSAACRHLGLTISAFFRGQKVALVVSKAELQKLKDGIRVFNTGRVELNVFNKTTSARSWLLSQREALPH